MGNHSAFLSISCSLPDDPWANLALSKTAAVINLVKTQNSLPSQVCSGGLCFLSPNSTLLSSLVQLKGCLTVFACRYYLCRGTSVLDFYLIAQWIVLIIARWEISGIHNKQGKHWLEAYSDPGLARSLRHHRSRQTMGSNQPGTYTVRGTNWKGDSS